MEIWHRVGFTSVDNVDAILGKLGIKYKKTPGLPSGYYLITFEIKESDPRWLQIAELMREKGKADLFFDTVFSQEEILSAEWVRLIPTFEQGYPQPEATWVRNPINYEGKCPQCGAGYRQVAPFRLAKEPCLGRHDFFSLYWTYTVFCTPRVLETLRAHAIRGYEVWEALLHKTGQPSRSVSQLVFPHMAGPGLLDEDKLQPETCSQCGLTKYAYHKRGYMHFKREALQAEVDILQTYEWFGSGGYGGYREILISRRLAELILREGWRGVRLKPVKLV
jgi:hypothetical protein